MAVWKVSYVIKESSQASGIINLNHLLNLANLLILVGTSLKFSKLSN